MKLWTRLAFGALSIAVCSGLAYSLHSETRPIKSPSGAQDFTLQRARDFTYTGGNVDCPNCKDMFSALLKPPVAGATILSMVVTARRPTTNNHWYRCQVEAKCGRPEFSDPANPTVDCIGKTSCLVNRATDDGVGSYEDDIRMTYQ
jgi:hypothetical protein